jgi:hypothetical protein
MEDNLLDVFDSQEKAIDHAIWLNFKYRIAVIRFGVIDGPNRNWSVCEEATAKEMETSFLDILPKNYARMTFKQIRHIKMDRNPLPHWEMLSIFSTMDGEILRYILHADIPLKKLIRFELAARGYDKNHRWCGFEEAEKIWLRDKQ